MKIQKKETKKIALTAISFIILSLAISICVNALPSLPTINYINNQTSSSAGLGAPRSDDKGGYITTINLDASQQNYAWKAYVGNVSGKLVLENNGQFSIFEWDMGLNAMGNVYISRNGTVNWAGINCSNRTSIQSEDTFLKLNSSNSNSINKTFNNTVHKSFTISGTTYTNSTCPAISTYVNDTAQSITESAKFQEVLLTDSSSNLVYMIMMEKDSLGYDNNTYDFQAIVGEDQTLPTPTTYYFYVELNG